MQEHYFRVKLLIFSILLFSNVSYCMEGTANGDALLKAINHKNSLAVRGALTFQLSQAELCRALLTAAVHGNAEIIRLLLGTEVNINCQTPEGNTAVHLAVLHNNRETLRALIVGECEIVASNSNGCCIARICNALTSSCQQTRKPANVTIRNNDGDTPMHIAARAVSDIIQEFPANAIRTARDAAGRTALHTAVESNNEQVVELLVTEGDHALADTVARNNSGNIPLDFANSESIRRILHESIAQEITFLRLQWENRPTGPEPSWDD